MSPEFYSSLALEPADLVQHFESIGDNCEFSLFQRYCGLETLDLLRFTFTPLPKLVQALENKMIDYGDPDDVEVYVGDSPVGPEYIFRIKRYDCWYHTGFFPSSAEMEQVRSDELKRIAFLKRKFLEDLATGKRILVRKGLDSLTNQQMCQLHSALCVNGPNTLLWVVVQDAERPNGSVEVVEPGILKGYIHSFAAYDKADSGDMLSWLEICRNAYVLWKNKAKSGTVLFGPDKFPAAPNLLKHSDIAGKEIVWQGISAPISDAVPAAMPGGVVFEHPCCCSSEETFPVYFSHPAFKEYLPETVYVFSLWVWISKDFEGQYITPVFSMLNPIKSKAADLSLRESWQRIWVSSKMPQTGPANLPALAVLCTKGLVFSCGWKVERGVAPTDYQTAALR